MYVYQQIKNNEFKIEKIFGIHAMCNMYDNHQT